MGIHLIGRGQVVASHKAVVEDAGEERLRQLPEELLDKTCHVMDAPRLQPLAILNLLLWSKQGTVVESSDTGGFLSL